MVASVTPSQVRSFRVRAQQLDGESSDVADTAVLDAVATTMQSVVTRPMAKGEVSTQLTALMDPPYLRFCRPCNTTHVYEMPFRLAALRAGLELQARLGGLATPSKCLSTGS